MSGFVPAAGDALVVPVAVVPVRAEPTHRSERISEWILGETVVVERAEGPWIRATGPDDYAGWTQAGPLGVEPAATERWEREATLRSLGTSIRSTGTPTATGRLARLPWGARLAPGSGGVVRAPGGEELRPRDPARIVPARTNGSPRDSGDPRGAAAAALVDAARDWLGVPYAWGGRTELGVDCSGFVQALFGIRGIALPRDSRDQCEAGRRLEAGPEAGFEAVEAGDLLFFAPEGRGVTHVALSEGGSRILHASASRGRVAGDDLAAEGGLCELLRDSWVARTRPLG